ncbi:hypothetical protein [Marivita hallyeonensis]|uniref:Uncharacterized protein n=1 Tax=Marivita hallyeonensis TaxID=996342 RepID=A0A1M5NLY0_9RHOB|nr:hypothetical protein [Marivita hallyeonensis]SHG90455.1 hypothetical protein SAMN05443551_0973 [Marivita hallyeonensis]
MQRLSRQITSLLLALVIAVTSVQFAAARGDSTAVATMVICTGSGPVHILVDENGEPTGKFIVCPDYATAFYANVWTPLPDALRHGQWRDIWLSRTVGQLSQALGVPTHARDPPPFV